MPQPVPEWASARFIDTNPDSPDPEDPRQMGLWTPKPRDIESEEWITFFELPTDGLGSYSILVMGPDDDERLSRKEARKLYGGHEAYATAWKKLNDQPPEAWADRMVELLEDGKPRTFHQMMLELTQHAQTASTAFLENPHAGLSMAIADGRIMITNNVPSYARLTDERAIHGDPALCDCVFDDDDDDEVAPNPVPPPPQSDRHRGAWVARTFPIGAPVRFQHTFEIDPIPVPKGTTGRVVGHNRSRSGQVELEVVLDPPPPRAHPDWVRIADNLRRNNVPLDDYIVWVAQREAVEGDLSMVRTPEPLLWPLIDTWGSTPSPMGRHHLPRSQRSWLKPNPKIVSLGPFAAAAANPVPPPPRNVNHRAAWADRTYPIGTPVVKRWGDDVYVAIPESRLPHLRRSMSGCWDVSHDPTRFDMIVVEGTRGEVVGRDHGTGDLCMLAIRIYEPKRGTSDPELVAQYESFMDHFRSPGLTRSQQGFAGQPPVVMVYVPGDLAPVPGTRVRWEPLVDTWGAAPRPRTRYRPNPSAPLYDVHRYEAWNTGEYCGHDRVRAATVLDYIGEQLDDVRDGWVPYDEQSDEAWEDGQLSETSWVTSQRADDEGVESEHEEPPMSLLEHLGVGEHLELRADNLWWVITRVA